MKGATLNSVDELKKHLKQLYGTGLSLTALQGLLSRQIQQNGESVLTFANKIRDIGNEIIQKKEAEGALPPTFEASVKASQIECFKNGLIDEIALRLTNNDDISAIITEAVKIEKDLEIKRGAQTNLININLLPSNIKINEKEKVSIEGIDQKPKVSYGKIKLSIFGMNIMFHVVDDSFNLPGDALLGAQFFHDNNAIINFKDLSLQLNNDKLKIEILNKDLGLDLSGKNNITPAELIYDFYNEPIDSLKTLARRSVPLGFIGSASKFLFGTLTEEDGLKYEQQIQDLSDKQLQLVKIAKDDSHLVHNKLNEMEEKMTNKWSDINASLKQLNKTAKDIYDLSSQWYRWSYETDANFVLNEIESLLNLFDDTLQSIHSIVTYCKVNLLHPDLVSSEQLHRIIRQIEDHDSDVEFPMPIMTARIEKLSNIASINMGFRDNKLIVKVTVPLLEKYPTFLYKMHSVPIPQELLTSRVSASIKPKSKYIAVNDHSNYYSLLNEENLHNCKEIGNRKICPKEHLMIEAHTEADCEYMLLHRPSIVNISNCDIILTHDSKDTWEFLSSINGWLYSVKNKESLLINCGEKQEYLQIQGIGILRIKPKCKATFRRMSINSFQGIGESIQFFYIPNIGINITHLDPNIPEKIAEILPALTRDNAFEDIKIPMQEIQNRYENLISNSRSNLIRNSITYTSVSTIAIICLVLSFGGYILFNLSKQHGYQLRTMNSKITGGMTVETPNHEIISHSEIPLQNAD
uniref:Uncharacterized protein n=1 Tax=Trichogramma kaykai TaxID=54128 RepID=A0ABD2X052_9HYME